MAQFNVSLPGISAEMLDELADFAERAWLRSDILEIEAIPGQPTTEAPTRNYETVDFGLPEPVPAIDGTLPPTTTGTIGIVLPDVTDELHEADKSTKKGRTS